MPEMRFRRMDQNSDGKISLDEARGRMKQNFSRVDSDENGMITPKELKARLNQMRR